MGHYQGTSQPEEAWRRLPNGGVFLDPYVIELDDLDAAGELRFNGGDCVMDAMSTFTPKPIRHPVPRSDRG